MGIRISNKKAGGKPEHENEILQTAIVDGQVYAFGFNMVRNVPDTGIGLSLASYSTTDNLNEALGQYGNTEGWTKS